MIKGKIGEFYNIGSNKNLNNLEVTKKLLKTSNKLIDLGSDVSAMPGMMDCHIHLCMYNNLTFKNYRVAQWEITPELQQMYMLFHAQLCLDRGITLRDIDVSRNRLQWTPGSTHYRLC